MATSQRLAAWVTETKEIVSGDVHEHSELDFYYITKAVVYALLTIAIAIHEAAEHRPK